MNRFHALPTWTLMQVARPFMNVGHPFKYNAPRLGNWAFFRTDLCKGLDTLMWVNLILIGTLPFVL